MKKIVIGILTVLSVFILSGCQSKTASVKNSASDKEKSAQQIQKQTISKNKSKWDSKVIKATKVDVRSYSETASYVSFGNLQEIKKSKLPLIKGTVVNYKRMSGIHYDTYSEANIKVDKVLMGDNKDLKDKTITVVFHGGLTNAKDFFYNMEEPKYNGVTINYGTSGELYIHDTDVPLPTIGSSIITPIIFVEYDRQDSSEFVNAMRSNHIKSKSAYIPYNPISEIWVKNSGAKEYVLNNENWRNITDPNNMMSQTSITKEINDAYNK